MWWFKLFQTEDISAVKPTHLIQWYKENICKYIYLYLTLVHYKISLNFNLGIRMEIRQKMYLIFFKAHQLHLRDVLLPPQIRPESGDGWETIVRIHHNMDKAVEGGTKVCWGDTHKKKDSQFQGNLKEKVTSSPVLNYIWNAQTSELIYGVWTEQNTTKWGWIWVKHSQWPQGIQFITNHQIFSMLAWW